MVMFVHQRVSQNGWFIYVHIGRSENMDDFGTNPWFRKAPNHIVARGNLSCMDLFEHENPRLEGIMRGKWQLVCCKCHFSLQRYLEKGSSK